ncbi:DUF3108 domain-containing protein [Albibacterium profundi]|uniref:DUF3108 domain-containing protein n=1 Tax=Albibacterium profundi TaxID=3134906 RepID=A0ABV5CCY5_9SPHI
MKKIILVAFISFLWFNGFSQDLPHLNEPVFKPGEVLKYKLKYGFVSAANGTLKVNKSTLKFDGKPTYHLSAEGKTSSAFSLLFGVHNRYNSYIDQDTFLPYFYSETIKEGKYRRNDKVRFYQKQRKIKGNEGTFKGASQTFDLLSAYYFARNLDLSKIKVGQSFNMTYFLNDEVSTLGITYLGKERIKTDMGTFNCLKFSPEIKPGRIFRKDSKLYLWVTDDGNRIPVKAEVEILVGSVTLELTDASGLKYPLKKN